MAIALPRLETGRASGWLAAALLGVAATTGCGPRHCDEPFESTCPARFDVNGFCRAGTCKVDGIVADDLAGAEINKGAVLLIPIAQFVGQLGSTRDLFVSYVNGAPSEIGAEHYVRPQESNAHVLLDGAAGAPFDAQRNALLAARGVSFRWSPFPGAPQRVEFSYEDGNVGYEGLTAWFEDGACEDQNVAPECLE